MDEARLVAILRQRLPVRHGSQEVGLEPDGAADHGGAGTALHARLSVTDHDTGEIAVQQVAVVPADCRDDDERVEAYLAAWLDALPGLVARNHGSECLLLPADLAYRWALSDTTARRRDEFAALFADGSWLSGWDEIREDTDFRDWVTGLGLGAFTEALRGAEVESVELPATVGGTGPVQLGGVPDLPPGVSWPATPAGPLVLLAQIDLAAAYLDSTGLPAEGTMQVFADLETGDVRLLVHPPDVPLAPAVVPDGCHVLPERRSTPYGVTMSFPPLHSSFYASLVDINRAAEVFAGFTDAAQTADDLGYGCRLLGYARALQDDPAYALATPEVPAHRWRLLLQFDPYGHDPDWLFGDGGIFYVMIPDTALAAGDLAAARGVFQCH